MNDMKGIDKFVMIPVTFEEKRIVMTEPPYMIGKVTSAKVGTPFAEKMKESWNGSRTMAKVEDFAIYVTPDGTLNRQRIDEATTAGIMKEMAEWFRKERVMTALRAYRQFAERSFNIYEADDKRKEERQAVKMAAAIQEAAKYSEDEDQRRAFLDGAFWMMNTTARRAQEQIDNNNTD